MAFPISVFEDVNRAIKECMDKDEQSCDYYEGLQSFRNGNYKYNSNRLERFKEISVPKAIVDCVHRQQQNTSQQSLGGFFEVIHRAYFVRGSSLYLWDYINSNRWCSLNEFNDDITAIGLVRSKENIFVEKIRFLLIVATKMEIKLLGIGFSDDSVDGEIEAFPTKYQTSTDNVQITKILSSPSSTRIFMACDHGNVYEFEYLYKQTFFGQHSRTCTKHIISDSLTSKILKTITFPQREYNQSYDGIIDLMVHDDLFNAQCLFSLSHEGVITGYKFEDDRLGGNRSQYPMTKMLQYSQLQHEAKLQINQMTDDNSLQMQLPLQLVGLYQIDECESQQCQLMALTSCGDRLYFAITPNNLYSSWTMELSFIRIRPPYLKYGFGNGQQHVFEPCILPSSSPQHVRCCSHQSGVTFVNALKSGSNDCVLLIERNDMECQSARLSSGIQLIESVESDVDSRIDNADRIVALCRMPLEQYVQHQSSFRLYSRKEIKKFSAGRPFVGLSPLSIQPLLPRPIILCLRERSIVFYKMHRHIDVLRGLLKDKNYGQIQAMLSKVGVVECQVMALLIAIGHDHDAAGDIDGRNQKAVAEEAAKFLKATLDSTTEFVYGQTLHRLNCQTTQILAIYLCLSRLLRPIWSYPICILDVEQNHKVSARYSGAELHRIINPLTKLKPMIAALAGNHSKSIDVWVGRCLEILNILVMVQRCQFNSVYDKLSNEMQATTLDIRFDELMTAPVGSKGFELLKSIISLMVPGLDIQEVRRLNHNCSSYFTSAQLMMFLAKSEMQNRSKLESALDMFCEVCDDDSFDVVTVCNWLRTEKYYNGVVKLVFRIQSRLIQRINTISKEEHQLRQMMQMPQSMVHGPRIEDLQREVTRLRDRIYTAWGEIMKCLRILYLESNLDDPYVQQKKDKLMKQCLQDQNKDFAFSFYDWFLKNQLVNVLFAHRPRYLEEFLMPTEERGDTEMDRNQRLEKLVHFWKEIGETQKVIRLLDAMTKKSGFTLRQRHEFLLEAKRACKSLTSNRSQLELDNVSAEIADRSHQFSERAVVCHIQLEVAGKLRQHPKCTQEDLRDLESRLMGVADIYRMSQQYGLHVEQLELLSFANDPGSNQYVERLWELIIAEYVHRFNAEWMQNLSENLHEIVNKFNLQQQPWMFDLVHILKYLHVTTCRISRNPSERSIIDALSKIDGISHQQLLTAFKRLLSLSDDQLSGDDRMCIIRSIRYLVQQIKGSGSNDLSMMSHGMSSIRDPRLCISNISQSIISSNPSVDDLIAQVVRYLERHNVPDQQLLEYFKSISSGII